MTGPSSTPVTSGAPCAEVDPLGHGSLEGHTQPASSPMREPQEHLEQQQGGSEEEGEQGQLAAGPDPGEAGGDSDLARYRELQHIIMELQELQIRTYISEMQRWVAALQQEIKRVQTLIAESRHDVTTAQGKVAKFGSGHWFPGKYLMSKKARFNKLAASRDQLHDATHQLEGSKEFEALLGAELQEASSRLAAWQAKAAELEAAQQEAAELEVQLFATPEDLHAAVELCALDRSSMSTVSDEEAEGESDNTEDAVVDEDFGQGVQSPQKEGNKRWGRGRLILLAAQKLGQAGKAVGAKTVRMAQRKSKQQQNKRLEKAATAISPRASLNAGSGEWDQYFPPAANTFKPLLQCPPSTFLLPYHSKFLGNLHKLQTGPVLQAFYRFGPFDVDPAQPNQLPSPQKPPTPEKGSGSGSSGGNASRPPPLILLPGLGATMIAWGVPLLRALACTHEVIIMEYRGAGLSVDSSGEPWNYYGQAEAVLWLADALGIEQPNILGWSSGGNTGLVLAALHSDRVGRVVSLAGMAGGHNTIVPPMYEMLNPSRHLSLGQMMALLFPADMPDFKKSVAEYLRAVASMPGAVTNSCVSAKAAQEQWVADVEFIHNDERVWDALPGITTPVLLLNGERDCIVPPKNAQRLAERIPGAQLHTFPSWGHGFKDPAELAEVVNQFLLAE